MRDGLAIVERSLLEADVSYSVVQDFMAHVTEQAMGEKVLLALRPEQQLIGIVFEELKNILGQISGLDQLTSENIIISNARHYSALSKVNESLLRVKIGLYEGIPEDLIAMDIRQAIHYLGEITGEITTDEILGNIFRNFCIGK